MSRKPPCLSLAERVHVRSARDLNNKGMHMKKLSISSSATMAIAFTLAIIATLYGIATSNWSQATMLALLALLFVVVALIIVQHDYHAHVSQSLKTIQDTQDEIATRLAKIESRLGMLHIHVIPQPIPKVEHEKLKDAEGK